MEFGQTPTVDVDGAYSGTACSHEGESSAAWPAARNSRREKPGRRKPRSWCPSISASRSGHSSGQAGLVGQGRAVGGFKMGREKVPCACEATCREDRTSGAGRLGDIADTRGQLQDARQSSRGVRRLDGPGGRAAGKPVSGVAARRHGRRDGRQGDWTSPGQIRDSDRCLPVMRLRRAIGACVSSSDGGQGRRRSRRPGSAPSRRTRQGSPKANSRLRPQGRDRGRGRQGSGGPRPARRRRGRASC